MKAWTMSIPIALICGLLRVTQTGMGGYQGTALAEENRSVDLKTKLLSRNFSKKTNELFSILMTREYLKLARMEKEMHLLVEKGKSL